MTFKWPEPNREELIQRVALAIWSTDNGLTYDELAKLLDKEPDYVIDRVRGNGDWTSLDLALIAERTGCTSSYFIHGYNAPPAYMYTAVTKPTSADIQTCTDCGAAILDSDIARSIHDEWHFKQSPEDPK